MRSVDALLLKAARIERPEVSVARYITVKRLAGNGDVLEILYRYYVLGESPSEIANEMKCTASSVKGYIGRIREKMTGGFERTRSVVEFILRRTASIEPIVQNGFCRICMSYVDGGEDHIMHSHANLVDMYLRKIFPGREHEVRMR